MGCGAKNDQNTDTQTQSTQSSIKDNFHSVKPDKDNDEAQEKPNTDETDEVDEENTEVRYQDDYYEFVNQNLLSKIELAATDAHWDWFGELNAVVSSEMEDIIDELANDGKQYEKGSSEQKNKRYVRVRHKYGKSKPNRSWAAQTTYGQHSKRFKY